MIRAINTQNILDLCGIKYIMKELKIYSGELCNIKKTERLMIEKVFRVKGKLFVEILKSQ